MGDQPFLRVPEINEMTGIAQHETIPHDVLGFLERQLKVGVCWVNLAEKRMAWSEGIFDLFGFERSVLPSRAALLDRMHPRDRQDRERVNVALQNRISFDDTFRIILGDRRVRWVRAYGEFLVDDQGRASALLVLMADATTDQNRNHLLCTGAKYLQAIAKLSKATVTIAAPSGRVTNVLYQQPFGRSASVLGTRWIDWVDPDDRGGMLTIWRDAVSRREEFRTEVRVRFPDGALSWRQVHVAPIRSTEGAIAEWLALSFDIDNDRTGQALLNPAKPATGTQLRMARTMLRMSVQRLSELTGVSIAVIRRLEELDGVSRDGSAEGELFVLDWRTGERSSFFQIA
ncbi:PAS domain-containing protein [Leptospira interrogans]